MNASQKALLEQTTSQIFPQPTSGSSKHLIPPTATTQTAPTPATSNRRQVSATTPSATPSATARATPTAPTSSAGAIGW